MPEQTCHRSAPIVDRDTVARTLTVQLCRWDEPRRVRDPWTAPYLETHARDSLVPAARLAVYDQHLGDLIGHMDPPDNAGPGPVARVHIAHTRAGDDVLALVDAGTIGDVSMEFAPDAAGEVWSANRDAVTRTRSTLLGCAFAFHPEHTAPILQREGESAMPEVIDTTAEETPSTPVVPVTPPEPTLPGLGLDAVQGELVAMRGELARLAGGRPAVGAPRFEHLGELMRAAATDQAGELARYRDPLGHGVVLHRAWTDVISTDVPGLMPTQRLTELYQVIQAAMPLVDAMGTMPPPTSLTITYPKITQRPLVAEQATQKTEIASRKILIVDATAPVRTYAGGNDVSLQVIQLSTPSYMEVAGQLYAEEMARVLDGAAYVQYAASAQHKVSIGTPATGWNAALFNLAALIATNSRRFPDRLVLSTDLWAKLGGAADADGRPLFTATSAYNPVGTASLSDASGNIRDLAYVVDPNFPTDRGAMFASQAYRASLGPVQTITADVPRLLGRDMAVFRFAAFAAVDPAGMGLFATGTAPTADEQAAEPLEAEGDEEGSGRRRSK